MANYNLVDENNQIPFLFGVGRVFEKNHDGVVYLVKSNTEFVKDALFGNGENDYFREVGNYFVGNFVLIDGVKGEERSLDFTWLGKEDYVALKYNEEYEDIKTVKMNIDNLAKSNFPCKKTKEKDMTLIVDASHTKMSSYKQIRALKDFIDGNGSSFKEFELIGFGKFIESILSHTCNMPVKAAEKDPQKTIRM